MFPSDTPSCKRIVPAITTNVVPFGGGWLNAAAGWVGVGVVSGLFLENELTRMLLNFGAKTQAQYFGGFGVVLSRF